MRRFWLYCAWSGIALLLIGGLITALNASSIEAALTLPSQPKGNTQSGLPAPTSPPLVGQNPTATAQQPATVTPIATSTVTSVASNVLAQDTFQRPDQSLWGVASDGHTWGADANTNTSFLIANHTGRMVHQHGSTNVLNATLGPPVTNAEVLLSGSLNSFRLRSNLGAILRWHNGDNWYKAYLNATQFVLLRDEAGVMTQLLAVPYAAQANTSYTLRFRVTGAQLVANIWLTGQTEPAGWMLQARDTTFASGSGGVRPFLAPGVEATITMFRELAVTASQ